MQTQGEFKGQKRFVIVYHDRYFQNISVNVKLQKYTRIRSKVKTYFSSLTTLTEDEDRRTGFIGVPLPWNMISPNS